MVGIEGKVEGDGGVAQRGGDVLSVNLHEAIAELIVVLQQQLLALLPEVMVSRNCQLQSFFGTLCEH